MKKILSLLIVIISLVSLAGCSNNAKDNTDAQSKSVNQESEEQAKKATENGYTKEEQIVKDGEVFETENGCIRILGVEKADPEVVDEENAYIVKFEVTNKSDEPRQGYEIFYWDIYQNNVEVTEINSRTSTGSEHDILLDNRHKGIMTGGTLEVGDAVVLEDESMLTIFFRDGLDLNNKTSMTVNVK